MAEPAYAIKNNLERLRGCIIYLEKEINKREVSEREKKEINDSIRLANSLIEDLEKDPNINQRELIVLRTKLLEIEFKREEWPLH